MDINLNQLQAYIDSEESKIREIENFSNEMLPNDDSDEEKAPEGKIWKAFADENSFLKMTHFTRFDIIDLFREMEECGMKCPKKGRKSNISDMDALLAYLVLVKTGMDYETLGSFLKISTSSLIRALDRIGPVLQETLKNRWWNDRKRPVPLTTTNFPYIALCADSTSIEINRPKARFEESKIYYDAKNKIYALKKECAVMASPPHYCLFSQRAVTGSTHDFNILKSTYSSYVGYLAKQNDEINMIATDYINPSWAILFDSAYVCDDERKTPELRKIALAKGERTQTQRNTHRELCRIRVVVEQFFGRLKSLWSLFRKPYRFAHDRFDMDFDICAMLTNEHIKANLLEDNDQQFYRNLRNITRSRQEDKQKRRREQVAESKKKKKQRSSQT